ncbi:MAG: class I SAM-dependent methyltransferase [Xanthomonadales bacterium]|nr:class I SAM-dependent methyltransferase [Xanthomonadales bacterium]
MMTVTIPTLKDWFSSKRGKALLQQEQKVLRHCLQAYAGDAALFLGPEAVLRDLPIDQCKGDVFQSHTQRLTDGRVEFSDQQVSTEKSWLFASESLDMVVLSHSLPRINTAELLNEAWRVLAPEGQLLLSVLHDQESPLNLSDSLLVQAMCELPQPADDRHYCGKLGLKWTATAPKIINQLCPLRILQWQKRKPGMVGKFKFSLPKTGSSWEYT